MSSLTPSLLDQHHPHAPSSATSQAISLTRSLPHGLYARILLLGSEDLRDILYTAYLDHGLPSRTLDITRCDSRPDVLARDLLILSFLVDQQHGLEATDMLWAISHQAFLTPDARKMLSLQAEKLIAASVVLDDWSTSHYGTTLKFCDQDTLADLRPVWQRFYDIATDGAERERASGNQGDLAPDHTAESPSISPASESQAIRCSLLMRSTAPLSQASRDIMKSFNGLSNKFLSESECFANPLVVSYDTGEKHSDSNSCLIRGFHLATAFAPLADASPLRFDPPEKAGAHDHLTEAAKTQFSTWISASVDMIKAKRLCLRFTTADALALCHTLQHQSISGETSAGWYRRSFDSRSLKLDDREKIPRSFDVIDTGDLADSVGTLNVLVAALPLLENKSWSTLSTTTFTETAALESEPEILDRLLCGHSASISLLLGAVAVNYWTNATDISSVDEMILAQANAQKPRTSHFRTQISWKHSWCLADSLTPQQTAIGIDTEGLEVILSAIYDELFGSHPLGGPTVSSAENHVNMARLIHYHSGSFMALINFLKPRIRGTDLDEVVEHIIAQKKEHQDSARNEQTSDTETLLRETQQELATKLHISRSPPALAGEQNSMPQSEPTKGGFFTRKPLPSVVAVTLAIPLDNIRDFLVQSPEEWQIVPMFQCSVSGRNADAGTKIRATFRDIHLMFGSLVKRGSPEADDFALDIQDDGGLGWQSEKAQAVVSLYMPTELICATTEDAVIKVEAVLLRKHEAYGHIIKAEEPVTIFEAQLDDGEVITYSQYPPGQSQYPVLTGVAGAHVDLPVDRAEEDDGSPAIASFVGNCRGSSQVQIITGRLNLVDPDAKALLTDHTSLRVRQISPCRMVLDFNQGAKTLSITFPLPIDGREPKIRLARKSSYIEMDVPFADPTESLFMEQLLYPCVLASGPGLPSLPVTLNATHLALDRLPILDISDKTKMGWLQTLTSFQFSAREKRIRAASIEENAPSTLSVNVKETLFTIFMLASGLQGGDTGIFALHHPDTGIHVLIFVSAIRLDPASASVVLDAAALPFTTDMLAIDEMQEFMLLVRSLGSCYLDVDTEELAFWKTILTTLAERCRTWSHRSQCEYAVAGSVPISTKPGESVLCNCGLGHFPPNFVAMPDWDLASRYATRIAISPIFASSLAEEAVDRAELAKAFPGPKPAPRETCRACGRTESLTFRDKALRKCTRCLRVQYCSGECQKKDWKQHRHECEEAEEHGA